MYIYIYIMSEWFTFVKAYALQNNILHKQALKDAPPSCKTRNEKGIEQEVITTTESKPKRKYNNNQLYIGTSFGVCVAFFNCWFVP